MDTPALYSGFDDPKTQGILALASALMQGSAPSRYPQGLAPLGAGLQAGLAQMNIAKKQQQEAQLAAQHAAVYRAQAQKLQADAQRQEQRNRIMQAPGNAAAGGGAPFSDEYRAANPPEAPWVQLEQRGQRLIDADFIDDGKKLIETAKILKDRLEMKDGVWYDKYSGRPVAGGHSVNQQGFGSQFNVGPDGRVSMGALPGSDNRYLTQARLGAQAAAERELVTLPPAGPGQPPRMVPKEAIVQAGGAVAGMPPNVAASQAAAAEQERSVSLNFGKIYNDLQNASMSNPGKIAKYQKIGVLLDGIEGGKLSQTGMDIASAANAAGIKIDAKLPNKEAAAAIANEIALELRSPAGGAGMPGAMSDQDREFLKSMTPQLAQTNEGRKQIIEARVKLMERESHVANMARRYRKKHGKMDDGFFDQLQDWSDKYPIFK